MITWVKCLGQLLPDAYKPETVSLVGELDELETFVGSKKTCICLWRAVDHFQQGIGGLVLGDGVQKRFDRCGQLCSHGSAISVVTDGWSVYPSLIPDGDQIVSKTYMTRVEGENTRQRHSASSTASQDTVLLQIRRTTKTLN